MVIIQDCFDSDILISDEANNFFGKRNDPPAFSAGGSDDRDIYFSALILFCLRMRYLPFFIRYAVTTRNAIIAGPLVRNTSKDLRLQAFACLLEKSDESIDRLPCFSESFSRFISSFYWTSF